MILKLSKVQIPDIVFYKTEEKVRGRVCPQKDTGKT